MKKGAVLFTIAAFALTASIASSASWRLHSVPIPQPGARSGLDAIAMAAPGDVWAVGADQPHLTDRTEALHWNAKRWSVVFTPNPSAGWAHFFGVAGRSADDVWAGGTYAPSDAGWPNLHFRALAEHWNGSTWRVVPTPTVGAADTLFDVAVLGPNDAWAVGGYYDSNVSFQNLQCEHTAHTLIEHWNGRVWAVVASPDPGASASFAQPCGPSHPLTSVNALSGVVTLRHDDAWSVGHYWDGTANRTLILHWNGQRWLRVISRNASVAENVLYSVAAVSARAIWAAGTYRPTPNGHYRTLIERWNGRAWRVVPSANVAGQDNQLYAIAARARNIWAVGRHDSIGGGPLAEYWNGRNWAIVPAQKSGDCACSINFNGVAVGPWMVFVAGEFIGTGVHRSLVEMGRQTVP